VRVTAWLCTAQHFVGQLVLRAVLMNVTVSRYFYMLKMTVSLCKDVAEFTTLLPMQALYTE
jgi:hypothetical protein